MFSEGVHPLPLWSLPRPMFKHVQVFLMLDKRELAHLALSAHMWYIHFQHTWEVRVGVALDRLVLLRRWVMH